MRSVTVTMPEYPDKETYLARSGSTFSKDKKYRYELHRIWDQNAPTVLFILLNPNPESELNSTDEEYKPNLGLGVSPLPNQNQNTLPNPNPLPNTIINPYQNPLLNQNPLPNP